MFDSTVDKSTQLAENLSQITVPTSISQLDSNTIPINLYQASSFSTELSEDVETVLPSGYSALAESLGQSQFSEVYGYGTVDAAAAVAAAIGTQRFGDVPNYSDYYDWGLDAIAIPEVWRQGYTGQNIVVAVVDSGVDYTHTDLDNNIWVNNGEIFGDGIDNDANGYIDDAIGWNFVANNNDPMDESNHGTHIAGIIAAEDNEYGITGVAYNAKIMPVRVLDADGNGNSENIAQGIYYAANNGANVINLSLGGDYSDVVADAVQYATQLGAIVVMAAGNDTASEPLYPGHLATDWGIAVGAIDSQNYMADFSNLAGSNSDMNYVVAPGVSIYSTIPGDSYEFMNGTSMAAPYVSGVAALMMSANPYLTPEQVREIITGTAVG